MGAVPLYAATTALPYPHLQRATAALRAELRRRAAEDGELPDWDTLAVTCLEETRDGRGPTWFEYRAEVAVCDRGASLRGNG